MGAVTTLMYASRDRTLLGIILDSPFASLAEVIDAIAENIDVYHSLLPSSVYYSSGTL